MLASERAVLIRYELDNKTYVGSGLRVNGQFVLTADHCAEGSQHRVVCNGGEHDATVGVRSHTRDVDLALLKVSSAPEVEPLGCALVNRNVAAWVDGCQALGFPRWKRSNGRVLAQVRGFVPTAEGRRADSQDGVGWLALKVTDPAIEQAPPIPEGSLEATGSPWAGMSGAAVVTITDELVIGVVRSHNPTEGGGSLAVTPLAAIDRLGPEARTKMWSALGVNDPRVLPILPKTGHADTGTRAERIAASLGWRRNYQAEQKELLSYLTSAFVGREDALAAIWSALAEPRGGYLLIEAPAGFGKSSLLAHLIQEPQQRTAEANPSLIFFLVQATGGDETASGFLTGVNSQLLDLLGDPPEFGVPSEPGALVTQFRALWSRAVARAGPLRPLVLVVDALDEAAPASPSIVELLPTELGPHTHVLVSTRPAAAHTDALAQGHPVRTGAMMTLGVLSVENIEQLLIADGLPASASGAVAVRVHDLTHGEPLLARFVCEDVALSPSSALERFESDPPDGVQDYFSRQLRLLETRTTGRAAKDLLGLLVAALAPLSVEELSDALDRDPWRAYEAVSRIRRFLRGETRVELMHAQLRAAVAQRLGRREVLRWTAKLLSWCHRYRAARWPEDTPAYILSFYALHLLHSGDVGLFSLVDPGWIRARTRQEGSPRGVLEDLALVESMAAAQSPPKVAEEIRAAIIRGTVISGSDNAPPAALGVLAQAGQLPRANSYAALLTDESGSPGKQAEAYRSMAEGLARGGEAPLAHALLDRAHTALASSPHARADPLALARLAASAAELGHPSLFHTLAEQLEGGEPGGLSQPLPDDPHRRSLAGILVRLLTATGDPRRIRELMAGRVPGEDQFFFAELALDMLATHGSAEDIRALMSGLAEWGRGRWLAAAACRLARLGRRAEAAELAADAAEKLTRTATSVDALADLATAYALTGNVAAAQEVAARAAELAAALPPDEGNFVTKEVSLETAGAALAVAGCDERARVVASAARTRDPSPAWAALAQAFAQAGNLPAAADAVSKVRTPATSAETYAAVAALLAGRGELETAVRWANAAISVSADAGPFALADRDAVRSFSKRLARMGYAEQLAATCSGLQPGLMQDVIRVVLACHLAEERRWSDALDQVRRIGNDEDQVTALGHIAGESYKAGDEPRAAAMVEMAQRKVATLGTGLLGSRGLAQVSLVEELAEAGAATLAQAVADGIESEWDKSQAAERGAAALARSRGADEAIHFGTRNGWYALWGWKEAVRVAARRDSSMLTWAASSDTHDSVPGSTLAAAARGSAEGGRYEEAAAVLHEIGNDEDRDAATVAASEAAAGAGDDTRAWELASQVRDPALRASLRARLIAGRDDPGTADRVLAELKAQPDANSRLRALTATAVALAPTNIALAVLVMRQALPVAGTNGRHEIFWTLMRMTDVLAGLGDGRILFATMECVLEISAWQLDL